ncbi:MAG: bifunctional adenosylcobinamide kinase/adenosylcobinamide-phosphate guanylyltransferase [Sphingopyxis sp.]|nr:bifunctional adenosylcobinamide kinase/adenosylcobinamide-phosphate guanylyltransferase [Sphingopyxis sp.]
MSRSSLFVLGGARSGKSRYAQVRAEKIAGRHHFVATAEAFDEEMRSRIARHQADRDTSWRTVEAPRDLPAVLDRLSAPDAVVLVDCLTLWLSNLILADADIDRAEAELCHTINGFMGHILVVSNEVGLGIVPANALARRFGDAAGRLNQAIAAVAAEVVLLTAGLPLTLKAPPQPQ